MADESEKSQEERLYDQAPPKHEWTRQSEPVEEASEEAVDAPETPEPAEPPAPPTFDLRHRESVKGLLYLGYLEETSEVLGHTFTYRTLDSGTQIAISMMIKDSVGNRSEMWARHASVVAASVSSVDGEPIHVPLRNKTEKSVELRAKYEEVLKWYPPLIDMVYQKITALEMKAREAFDALGKGVG